MGGSILGGGDYNQAVKALVAERGASEVVKRVMSMDWVAVMEFNLSYYIGQTSNLIPRKSNII